jgi:PAS domain-containing protein
MDSRDESLADAVLPGAPDSTLRGAARPETVVAILERVTDGIFFLDRDWRFVYLNARARAAMERGGPSLLGRSLWEAFPALVGSDYEAHWFCWVVQG